MTDLTKSELAILRAIDAAPGKTLDWHDCRKAANLTVRGSRAVLNRMFDTRLIGRSELPDTFRQPTLTFKGQQYLEAANAAD